MNQIRPEEHIGLVKSIAASYKLSCPASLDYQDLVQEGCMGLLEASKRYDPDKGAFSTYATPWIRKFIGLALENHRRTIRIPRHERERASAEGKSYTSHSSEVSEDMLVLDSNAEYELDVKNQYLKASKIIIQQLDEKSQLILRLRFIQDVPRSTVAKMLGHSREWTRTLEYRALNLLRIELKKDSTEND